MTTDRVAGPDWKSGRLAVVLTADEDDKSAGNRVLTVVAHPSQRHRVVTARLDHYSLTRLYAEVTGTAPLGSGEDRDVDGDRVRPAAALTCGTLLGPAQPQPSVVQPGVVDAEVVGDLVHDGHRDLVEQVVAVLAHPGQRPAEDGDPVRQGTRPRRRRAR